MFENTEMGPGVHGAKVQSWRKDNPRDVLKTIVEKIGSNRAKVFKTFRERIFSDEGEPYLEAIIEYWFANNYHSLLTEGSTSTAEDVERASRAYKARVQRHITEQAKVLLLELMLPNGKKLADCTGRECSALAKKIGPWLEKIASQLKPTERVGDKLTELEVRKLFDGK